MSGNILGNIAIGLVAGAIGTAAMTAAQTAQMKATGRSGSTTPAKAAENLFGLDPWTDAEEETLSNKMHWAYGTALGGVCGILASLFDDQEPLTGLSFLAMSWTSGLFLPAALKASSPPTEWAPAEIASDAAFHAVYAGATVAAFHGIQAMISKR